jgi:hypothetical protein
MNRPASVLAIAPVYRGIGFIVFDETQTPIDWGVKEARVNKHARCREHVNALLLLHRPQAVILERTGGPGCKRRRRMRELIADLASVAEIAGYSVALYERAAVAVRLGLDRFAGKDAIAGAVAQALPVLSHRLPRSRKIWEGEKHSMAMFEAAGLALAHFSATDSEPRGMGVIAREPAP